MNQAKNPEWQAGWVDIAVGQCGGRSVEYETNPNGCGGGANSTNLKLLKKIWKESPNESVSGQKLKRRDVVSKTPPP